MAEAISSPTSISMPQRDIGRWPEVHSKLGPDRTRRFIGLFDAPLQAVEWTSVQGFLNAFLDAHHQCGPTIVA
jgi:hypothetical protein